MVRQSCGDFIYLVMLLFLGGGSYSNINSKICMVSPGPALPGKAPVYTCAIFIKNIYLHCQKCPGLDDDW